MAFRVGQKVVCVDDSDWVASLLNMPNRPVRGRVYTVRGLYENAIYLEEISNPPQARWKNGDVAEACFFARRFRPVVERKTDISAFTKMLTGKRVDA